MIEVREYMNKNTQAFFISFLLPNSNSFFVPENNENLLKKCQ